MLLPKLGIWNPLRMAESLSIIIIRVSVQESGQLYKIWEERMEKTKEWLLIADYCLLLTAIVDKLVAGRVLPGPRKILINTLLEQIKKAFNQTNTGSSDRRNVFYDELFNSRMEYYSPFKFIMTRLGFENDLIFEASKLLVEHYLPDLPESSKAFFVERTERYIANSIAIILKTKPFREIALVN